MINGHALDDCSVGQVKGKTEKLSVPELYSSTDTMKPLAFPDITVSVQALDTQSGRCKTAKFSVFVLTPFKSLCSNIFLFDGVRTDSMKSTICNFQENFFPRYFLPRGKRSYQLMLVEVIATKMSLIY